MNIQEYRKQVAERLAEAAKQQATFDAFLDRERSGLQRLESVGIGRSSAEEEVARLLEVISDRSEETRIRVAGVQRTTDLAEPSVELIESVLALLRDTGEPAELRRAALAVVRQLHFNPVVTKAMRPSFMAALRALVDDSDVELRVQAIILLAQQKDEYVQRRLLEGLRDPSKGTVPPEKAIQLLGYDIHAEHFPLLHEFVRNPPNDLAKQEAVRLLSADPTAAELLVEVVRDKAAPPEVRKAGAVALQSMAPVEFEKQAKAVVLDDGEAPEVRASFVGALEHFGNPAALEQDGVFSTALDGILGPKTPKVLEAAVRRFKGGR